MPSRLRRAAEMFGFARAAEPAEMPVNVAPPRPEARAYVSQDRALTLSTVYRFVQIHATAACQLTLGVERNGVALERTPALISSPDLDESLSSFLEYVVVSMYLDGNSFWHLIRSPFNGEVVDIKPVNPREVAIYTDPRDKVTKYSWKGKSYTRRDMLHLRLLRVPGVDRGLGPIQAAQVELAGALDARDYGSLWFQEGGIPDGILTTDQELGAGDADKYKHLWEGRNPDGSDKTAPEGTVAHTSRIRVMGKGLSYTPLLLKPADVQFLESQKFSTTQMARLMGVPASLAMTGTDGNSQTYANVEQEWIAYIRFSLMLALREIEEAFTGLLPRGQKARFTIEALLRADTKTRYEGHMIALGRWMTADEIRAIENLAPLTDEQREQLTQTPAAEPAKKETVK